MTRGKRSKIAAEKIRATRSRVARGFDNLCPQELPSKKSTKRNNQKKHNKDNSKGKNEAITFHPDESLETIAQKLKESECNEISETGLPAHLEDVESVKERAGLSNNNLSDDDSSPINALVKQSLNNSDCNAPSSKGGTDDDNKESETIHMNEVDNAPSSIGGTDDGNKESETIHMNEVNNVHKGVVEDEKKQKENAKKIDASKKITVQGTEKTVKQVRKIKPHSKRRRITFALSSKRKTAEGDRTVPKKNVE